MGLFSSKRKTTTEVFSKEFYDQSVFAPNIAGSDPWFLFCEGSQKMIAASDHRFNQVKTDSLMDELKALRLEVVGLAWLHQVKDKFAPVQSDFTKRYLESKGAASIWQMMEAYNKAVARSTTLGVDPNTSGGRARITFINQMRAGIFDEWYKLGYDPEAVARAANRLASDVAWKTKAVHIKACCTPP